MELDLIVESEPIDQGGFGSIYNCKYKGKRYVAKKIPLLTNGFIDKPMEFIIMGSSIPHVNKHQGILFHDSNVYILQDKGISLKHMRRDSIIEYSTMITWCKMLLTSVKHVHRYGFIHCDIKPDNILVVNNEPVLADLGLMTISHGKHERSIGTSSYRAPEVWDKKYKSTALDIWSLGLTFYYIIQGIDLFHLDSHISDKEVKKKLYKQQLDEWRSSYPNNSTYKLSKSHPMSSIILSMLNPDPEQRPTANDILKYTIFSKCSTNIRTTIPEINLMNKVDTDLYVRWIYELCKRQFKDEDEGIKFSKWMKQKIINGHHIELDINTNDRYLELERWLVSSRCYVPKMD